MNLPDNYADRALMFNKRARDVKPTLEAMGFEAGTRHVLEVQAEQIGVLEKQCADMANLIGKMAGVIELVSQSNDGLMKELEGLKKKYRDVDEETGRTN